MKLVVSLLFCWSLTLSLAQAADSGLMKDLSFKTSSGTTLKYLLFVPKNYSASQKYPLVVTLHGAGGAGDKEYSYQVDNNDQAHPWIEDSVQAKWPHFIMAPMCPGGSWGGMMGAGTALSAEAKAVIEAIEDLKKQYSLDTNRFIIGGFSLGGAGTYHMIQFLPSYWAAACPVAAGGAEAQIDVIAKTPIWHHQGLNDNNGAALTRMATALEGKQYPTLRITCDMVVNSPTAYKNEINKGTKPENILFKNAKPSYDSVSKAVDAGAKYIYQLITGANHEDSRLNANHNLLMAKWALTKTKGGATTIITPVTKTANVTPNRNSTMLTLGNSSGVVNDRIFSLLGQTCREYGVGKNAGAQAVWIRIPGGNSTVKK